MIFDKKPQNYKIESERLKLFLSSISFGFFLPILAIVLGFLLWQNANKVVLVSWVLIVLVIVGIRIFVVYTIKKQGITPENLDKNVSILIILFIATSLVFGFGIPIIATNQSPYNLMIIMMAIFGISTGVATGSSYYKKLVFIYLIILNIPYYIFLYMSNVPHIEILIVFEFLFLVMIISVSANLSNAITNLLTLKQQLNYQVHHDPLTGLANRKLLEQHLEKLLYRLKRSEKYGLLILFDIDNFKEINDIYGHDIGDKVLKTFSERADEVLRNEDVLARMGGDEFIILPLQLHNNKDQAISVVDAISKKIQKVASHPIHTQHKAISITLSIGAKIITPENQNINDIFKNVDIAMYQSKKSGKNQVTLHEPNLDMGINYHSDY